MTNITVAQHTSIRRKFSEHPAVEIFNMTVTLSAFILALVIMGYFERAKPRYFEKYRRLCRVFGVHS